MLLLEFLGFVVWFIFCLFDLFLCSPVTFFEFREQIRSLKTMQFMVRDQWVKGQERFILKKMIHSLLTAVHLKRDEFCKGAQPKELNLKTGPFSPEG